MGQRFTLNKIGEHKISLITKNMIPEKIYTRLINNQKIIHEKLPFTVMNYFTNDSTIKFKGRSISIYAIIIISHRRLAQHNFF